MKIIAAIAVGFFGLVPSVFVASSAQDGSKMKLGDPVPAVTVPNQDMGSRSISHSKAKRVTHSCTSIRRQ